MLFKFLQPSPLRRCRESRRPRDPWRHPECRRARRLAGAAHLGMDTGRRRRAGGVDRSSTRPGLQPSCKQRHQRSARGNYAGKGRPPANPQLSIELQRIAEAAIAAPRPRTIAVIRTPLAAGISNPTGRPDWTRGARIIDSYGPFQDLQGVAHWVDLVLRTVALPFAFGSPASPFAVFPVREFLHPPPTPSSLSLGAGSAWFLANMLSPAFPGGSFTGLAITGGALNSSAPLSFQNGVYVVPANATLTVTLTLAPASLPVSSGGPGADAAAAIFTPPPNVTIRFQQSGAAFEAIADSSAQAYGSTVKLHWNRQAPIQVTGLP